MKFYDKKTKDDKIIERARKNHNCYWVKYLHDDEIYEINKLELDVIAEMIKQAELRDAELYKKYNGAIIKDIATYSIAVLGSIMITKGNLQILLCFLYWATVYFIETLKRNAKKQFELKKYHMFLEMREDLKKEENKNILDVIEFEKIYQDPRGIVIDNLDNYSYHDIKTILKELKRRKELNNNYSEEVKKELKI